jgi:hypothetical protein
MKFTANKIAAIVFAAGFALTVVSSYISAANYGNRTEVSLRTKMEDNENIYANGTQKVMEIAQVPDMYVDAVSKVTREAIQGRYGNEGSKAVFQMLQEQNPQLDPAMFVRIQQVIEAFRDQFQNAQTQMLDQRRAYETALGTVWQGFWLGIAGYPKIDLSKYTIVTTSKARQTFETKRDTGIQLRQK